jgi:hypothetical protein
VTTVQVLRKARRLIKRGWCKGIMRRYRYGKVVGHCALGAIVDAIGSPYGPKHNDAVGRFENVIRTNSSITTWNDSPFRRKAEVLAAFDRAIKACR